MSRREDLQFYSGLALGVGVFLLLVGVVLLQGNPPAAESAAPAAGASAGENR